MKSEKILVDGKEFYINSEDLENPNTEKLFLFLDSDLKEVAKTHLGRTRMILKADIEEVLKENIGGAGGAGYAVWGGGWGRSFGNPSQGGKFTGRGFGFGGSQNLGGGPNIMYTYAVKPLNTLLQQPGTPQGAERYIHVGSEVKGKILGKDKKIDGKVIAIKDDNEGNILHYLVQDLETAEKYQLDPTSIQLITHEELPAGQMMDFVGIKENEFYPRLAKNENSGKIFNRAEVNKIMEQKKRGS